MTERMRVGHCPLTITVSVQDAAPDEVGILRTEVARLQTELTATTEKLEAASAAAEAERSAQLPY